uniref:Uncharacterized protein n=1 Tax=Rhizophora mucronata TaxID=61149 RepID=A0A2P2IHF8_RHIMU
MKIDVTDCISSNQNLLYLVDVRVLFFSILSLACYLYVMLLANVLTIFFGGVI